MAQEVTKQEENLDMFGMEGVTLDDVDSLLDEEEEERWPEAVRQMYDLFKHELEKAGVDDSIAINLISATCQNFGGMQFYLGRGKSLERHLRNLKIWNDFNGNNVPELIKKYDASYSQVYRVIKKMRQRELNKRQPQLF